jgi:uncharacterized protein YozE (UPF0346 family)
MTNKDAEFLSEFLEIPQQFFLHLRYIDKKLYERYLQQVLDEIQDTLGKG